MTRTIFDEWPLEAAIERSVAEAGLPLAPGTEGPLASHARAVATADPRLHLTSIGEPEEFVRRHIVESLAGLSLLPAMQAGVLVDLGSGNGYPGIPLALAAPGLRLVLVEASPRKATFLSELVSRLPLPGAEVLEVNVQRAVDLVPVGPVTAIVTRAMGGWARLLPKLAPVLVPGGRVLVWTGEEIDAIARRVRWQRFRQVGTVRASWMERCEIRAFELASPQG